MTIKVDFSEAEGVGIDGGTFFTKMIKVNDIYCDVLWEYDSTSYHLKPIQITKDDEVKPEPEPTPIPTPEPPSFPSFPPGSGPAPEPNPEPEPDLPSHGEEELVATKTSFVLTGYDFKSILNGKKFGPNKQAVLKVLDNITRERVKITELEYDKKDVKVTQTQPGNFNIFGRTTKKGIGTYETVIKLGAEGYKNKITVNITLKVLPAPKHPKLNTRVKTVKLSDDRKNWRDTPTFSLLNCKIYKWRHSGDSPYGAVQTVCTSYTPWCVHALTGVGIIPTVADMIKLVQTGEKRPGLYGELNQGSTSEMIQTPKGKITEPTDIYVLIYNESPYNTKAYISFNEM